MDSNHTRKKRGKIFALASCVFGRLCFVFEQKSRQQIRIFEVWRLTSDVARSIQTRMFKSFDVESTTNELKQFNKIWMIVGAERRGNKEVRL